MKIDFKEVVKIAFDAFNEGIEVGRSPQSYNNWEESETLRLLHARQNQEYRNGGYHILQAIVCDECAYQWIGVLFDHCPRCLTRLNRNQTDSAET